MVEVYISLGSNIDPAHNICQCLHTLHTQFGVLRCSQIYQTPAVGFVGEPFLNAVVSLQTACSSGELKAWLKQLEVQQGRIRSTEKFNARTLDADLLVYGNEISSEHKLPHPDILRYDFVLKPLAELAPNSLHPVLGTSFLTLATQYFPNRQLESVELICAKLWQLKD